MDIFRTGVGVDDTALLKRINILFISKREGGTMTRRQRKMSIASWLILAVHNSSIGLIVPCSVCLTKLKMTVRGTMVRSEVCNSWCFCLES